MKESRLKNRKLPALPLLTYYSLITDKNPGAAVRHIVLIILVPFSCFFRPLSRSLPPETDRQAMHPGLYTCLAEMPTSTIPAQGH